MRDKAISFGTFVSCGIIGYYVSEGVGLALFMVLILVFGVMGTARRRRENANSE